jgi:hypothetical protein
VSDSIVTIAAKQLIHTFTQSIVKWIQNGFEGSPMFVTNPENFFATVANNTIGEYVDGTALGFLCDPFKLQIQLGLRLRYGSNEYRGCKLTDIINNVNGFVDGSFKDNGGWKSWIQISNQERGNAYDSYLDADTRLNIAIQGRQGTELMKLNWGRGFLSSTDEETGEVKTPGSVVEGQLQSTLNMDISNLGLADELDEIVGALVGTLLNKVLTTSGLSGAS